MNLQGSLAPQDVLSGIPNCLREPLLQSFNDILRNFREGRWEPSELNGGKLSEIVYSILSGFVNGQFPSKPSKPKNMVQACQTLEQASPDRFSRSVRIQIPRVLVALYEVRNNRGVGHAGGDVDPNRMDAMLVVSAAKWIIAELIRLFHDVDTKVATGLVQIISERTVPLVWEVAGRRRVLNNKLSMKEKMLILLYGTNGEASEADLLDWTEHSNAAVFRRDVLSKAHKARLIEYDRGAGRVHLSPLGIKLVEEEISFEV